jgi:hypothetical protein
LTRTKPDIPEAARRPSMPPFTATLDAGPANPVEAVPDQREKGRGLIVPVLSSLIWLAAAAITYYRFLE